MKRLRRLLTHRGLELLTVGAVVVSIYTLLHNFASVRAVAENAISIISPFTTGLLLAYLLNLFMSPLEGRLGGIKRPAARRAVALLITMLLFAALIFGLMYALIPQLIASVGQLVQNLEGYLNSTDSVFDDLALRLGLSPDVIERLFGTWSEFVKTATDWIVSVMPTIVSFSVRFGSGLLRALISIFTAVYILSDKEHLCGGVRMIAKAFCSDTGYRRLGAIAQQSHRTFSRYAVGTLIDSLAVGIVCYIGMLILKIPYPILVSVFVGVTNIIPNFGPFIGAIPSILIILIAEPIKALYFGIFILVLQQVEGNLLIPKILGDITGLSALWVLVSICICGALWGVAGMILGVPVCAVLYSLAAEYIKKRLLEKGYDTSGRLIEPEEPEPRRDRTSN